MQNIGRRPATRRRTTWPERARAAINGPAPRASRHAAPRPLGQEAPTARWRALDRLEAETTPRERPQAFGEDTLLPALVARLPLCLTGKPTL